MATRSTFAIFEIKRGDTKPKAFFSPRSDLRLCLVSRVYINILTEKNWWEGKILIDMFGKTERARLTLNYIMKQEL